MVELVIQFGDVKYTIPYSRLEETEMTEEEFLKEYVKGSENEENISGSADNVADDMSDSVCKIESNNA